MATGEAVFDEVAARSRRVAAASDQCARHSAGQSLQGLRLSGCDRDDLVQGRVIQALLHQRLGAEQDHPGPLLRQRPGGADKQADADRSEQTHPGQVDDGGPTDCGYRCGEAQVDPVDVMATLAELTKTSRDAIARAERAEAELRNAPEATAEIKQELALADAQWVLFGAAISAKPSTGNAANVFSASENLLTVMDKVTGLYSKLQKH